MEGRIEAHSVIKKDGRIFLGGGDEGNVNVAGHLNTSGENSGDSGGEIFIQGASVILDKGLIQAKGKDAKGGDITITGSNWLSVGGQIDASGDSGGNIKLTAGGLSIAAPFLPRAAQVKVVASLSAPFSDRGKMSMPCLMFLEQQGARSNTLPNTKSKHPASTLL